MKSDGKWSGVANPSGEVMKDLSDDERKDFTISDANEWAAIKKPGAVRVLSPEVARLARARYPDRVLSSRMVRRLKPQPGVGARPKAKSRWCVHGHQDPDTGSMERYAPTPTSSSVLMFLLITQTMGVDMCIADATNAFCQPKALKRLAGPLFVEPCEGIPEEKGSFIQLEASVYGLDDAPFLWHETLTDFCAEE